MGNEELQKKTQQKNEEGALQVFGTNEGFEQAQRMAKMLASSKLVPQQFQNNTPDCVLALEMSQRIGASVFSVLQNMYVVHGKPAFSAQFLISCLNASGRFTPMRYRMTGTPGQDDYGCIAWAKDGDGELLESPEVTIAMAKSEGWYEKNGSKWKTMPALMLRYRAATLFVRLYAPEITMGMLTDHEVIDITPGVTEHPQPTGNNAEIAPDTESAMSAAKAVMDRNSVQSQSEQSSQSSTESRSNNQNDTQSTDRIAAVETALGLDRDTIAEYCHSRAGNYRYWCRSLDELSAEKLDQMVEESDKVKREISDWYDQQDN